MRVYEIQGIGRDTGRARRRRYLAPNEHVAREMAEKDGTRVEQVIDRGPEPPTGPQIEYANFLGVKLPHDVSKGELSQLIDNAQRGANPASDRELAIARSFGVTSPPRYIDAATLGDLVQNRVFTQGRAERVRWYIYFVFIGRSAGKRSKLITSPDDPILLQLASRLSTDDKLMESIDRARGVRGENYFIHGLPESQSYAYKCAVDILGLKGTALPKSSELETSEKMGRDGTNSQPLPIERKPYFQQEISGKQLVLIIIMLVFLVWVFAL